MAEPKENFEIFNISEDFSELTFFSEIFRDEILVYKVDQEYFACSTFCPHFGGPLKNTNNVLRCYWHGWEFDRKTHKCLNHDVNCVAKSYLVTVSHGKIKIQNVS